MAAYKKGSCMRPLEVKGPRGPLTRACACPLVHQWVLRLSLVSLRNRMAGRRGRQNICVLQT